MKPDVVLLTLTAFCLSMALLDIYKRWEQTIASGYLKLAEHDRQIVALTSDVQRLRALTDVPTKEHIGYI